MKKLLAIILALLLISGCSTPAVKNEEGFEASVKALLQERLDSVKSLDVQKLMSILDPEDKELQIEQANWLADIKMNPIQDYSLELLKLEKISDDVYKAKLHQSYKEGAKEYKLEYNNKYKLIEGKLFDAGNYFEELKQENITIKYTAANKRLAEEIIGDMNKLFDDNSLRWGLIPERPLVIKMFEDIEELRQSIKFSMWKCAGWYEYGESVKMYMTKSLASKERIQQVVNHEMTHLFTVERSAGNLAYWLAEGIASYYETPQTQKTPEQLIKEMDDKLMSLDELEATELEKLADQRQISSYYNNSHLVTAFIINEYGEGKLKELLEELRKYPVLAGTTSENDKEYRKYLSQALPKVLGMNSYVEFKQQWQNEVYKLQKL